MSRHIVCLSIELDAEAPYIARGETSAGPLARGAYDAVGAGRLLDLLTSHAVPATWFVPGVTLASHPKACERIVACGHEIGHHGWAHVPPLQQTRSEEEADFVRAEDAIRALVGASPHGFRAPGWDLRDHTIMLLESYGIVYDSSLMGGDVWPYPLAASGTALPGLPYAAGAETDIVEMPIAPTRIDQPDGADPYRDGAAPGGPLPALLAAAWRDEFLAMRDVTSWGVVTYTLHAGASGRGAMLRALDGLIDDLLADGAVFATMETAAREARERLFGAMMQAEPA